MKQTIHALGTGWLVLALVMPHAPAFGGVALTEPVGPHRDDQLVIPMGPATLRPEQVKLELPADVREYDTLINTLADLKTAEPKTYKVDVRGKTPTETDLNTKSDALIKAVEAAKVMDASITTLCPDTRDPVAKRLSVVLREYHKVLEAAFPGRKVADGPEKPKAGLDGVALASYGSQIIALLSQRGEMLVTENNNVYVNEREAQLAEEHVRKTVERTFGIKLDSVAKDTAHGQEETRIAIAASVATEEGDMCKLGAPGAKPKTQVPTGDQIAQGKPKEEMKPEEKDGNAGAEKKEKAQEAQDYAKYMQDLRNSIAQAGMENAERMNQAYAQMTAQLGQFAQQQEQMAAAQQAQQNQMAQEERMAAEEKARREQEKRNADLLAELKRANDLDQKKMNADRLAQAQPQPMNHGGGGGDQGMAPQQQQPFDPGMGQQQQQGYNPYLAQAMNPQPTLQQLPQPQIYNLGPSRTWDDIFRERREALAANKTPQIDPVAAATAAIRQFFGVNPQAQGMMGQQPFYGQQQGLGYAMGNQYGPAYGMGGGATGNLSGTLLGSRLGQTAVGTRNQISQTASGNIGAISGPAALSATPIGRTRTIPDGIANRI